MREKIKWLSKITVLSFFLTSTVILTRVLGTLQPLEWRVLDLGLRWRPSESTDSRITLVKITDRDIQDILLNPISDQALAELIQTLQAYEPRVIGIDILLEAPIGQGYEQLKSVLQSSGNIVGINTIGGDVPIPHSPFLSEEQLGFADAVVDDDGFLRRSQLAEGDENNKYWKSFTIRLTERYLEPEGVTLESGIQNSLAGRFGNAEIPHFQPNTGGYVDADAAGHQTLINYRAGNHPFDEFSYAEILSGAVEDEMLTDRILIVGFTARSKKDSVSAAAVSNYDPTLVPGIAIQAHAVSQILSAFYDGRPFLRVLPDAIEYSLILVMGLLGALLAYYRQTHVVHWFMVSSLGVLWLLLSYSALILGWWLPAVPVIMAVLINGIALYPFFQAKSQLQSQNSQKEKLVQRMYSIIHNEALQTIAIIMRSLDEGQSIPSSVRQLISHLNNDLRGLPKKLNEEILSSEKKLIIEGEIIDPTLPLSTILEEVFSTLNVPQEKPSASFAFIKNIEFVNDSTLSEENKKDIGRFLQEAITNVRKHSQGATRITLEVIQEDSDNIVRITDNGKGVKDSKTATNGNGGDGTQMAEQLAAELNGKFRRVAASPKGVICELRWPIKRPFWMRWLR